MTFDTSTVATRIEKVKRNLVLKHPFFAMIALRQKYVETKRIPTMAVDGVHLFYNPAFVEKLTFNELLAVFAHEVLHLACAHHARRGSRDLELWNEACDLAINPIVEDAGFTLPEDALLEERFRNLAAETIYARLEKEQTSQAANGQTAGSLILGASDPNDGVDGDGPSWAPDPGGCGGVIDAVTDDGRPVSPDEMERVQKDWEIIARQAAQIARTRAQGELPAGLERFVASFDQPTVDYRSLLRLFVDQSNKNDYRWTPPNRRYISQGLFLPSLSSPQLRPIVIAIDTSGSIGDEELAQFAAEVNAIIAEWEPEWVDVVYCDAGVASVERFGPDDWPVTLHASGGGGTSFRPAFDWVEREQLDPACFIYFTDLYGDFPDDPPDYPVLWLTTTKGMTAPFGETVEMELGAH